MVTTPNRGKIEEEITSALEVKELDQTGVAADDDLAVLVINNDMSELVEDSDGDSVMSGVEENDSEEKNNNKTTVIVLKAEPLDGTVEQDIAVVQDSVRSCLFFCYIKALLRTKVTLDLYRSVTGANLRLVLNDVIILE